MPNSKNNDLTKELAALKTMSPAQLRDKYLAVFAESSRSGNKDFLLKRIAWRIQALAEGGLSERAKTRALELARDADLRTTMPRVRESDGGAAERTSTKPLTLPNRRLPMPGAVLTRDYRGKQAQVTVLPAGFEHDGTVYKSLSAVAKAVTGSHWNGYGFFGLLKGEN